MKTWPRMSRGDRRVERAIDGRVQIFDEDASRLMSVSQRSLYGPLVAYTVPVIRGDMNHAYRSYIEGRTLRTGQDADDLRVLLKQLHREDDMRTAQPEELAVFYNGRLLSRSRTRELCGDWPGWQRLVHRRVAWSSAWHGDPTLTNCIKTPGGRLVLIDHSHLSAGPIEWDFAKLRRSELLSDDMERVGEVTADDRRDDALAAVVAGMIGSHPREQALVELWRELTQ